MKVLAARVNEITKASGHKMYAVSFDVRLLWFKFTLWTRGDDWTSSVDRATTYTDPNYAEAAANDFLRKNSPVKKIAPLA